MSFKPWNGLKLMTAMILIPQRRQGRSRCAAAKPPLTALRDQNTPFGGNNPLKRRIIT
jgi:hypothetical protein